MPSTDLMHEFAYGAVFDDVASLPKRLEEFLSLSVLDDAATRVEVSELQGGAPHPALRPVLVLDEPGAETPTGGHERAVELTRRLLRVRDTLSDAGRQDDVIVFVTFALKRPAELPDHQRETMLELVRRFDGREVAALIESGHAPARTFEGNVNLYPLALDNTSWHDLAEGLGDDRARPVLEVRFGGPRGLARFLYAECERATGLRFVYLDGETL